MTQSISGLSFLACSAQYLMPAVQPWSAAGIETPTLNRLPALATAPPVVDPIESPPDWQPTSTMPAAMPASSLKLFIFLPSPLHQHRHQNDDSPHQALPVCVDVPCRNHIRD